MREPDWNSLAQVIEFFQILHDMLETVAETRDFLLEAYQDTHIYKGLKGVAKGH